MNSTKFTILCILALIVVILFSFVSSAIHKFELCQKTPYYYCDNTWQCCKVNSDGSIPADCPDPGKVGQNTYPITEQLYGKGSTNASGQAYKIVSGNAPVICSGANGSVTNVGNYYEACIKPIEIGNQLLIDGKINFTPDYSCLYDKNISCGNLNSTVFANYTKESYTVQSNQCCYTQYDYRKLADGGDIIAGQIYPTSTSTPGTWNTYGFGQSGGYPTNNYSALGGVNTTLNSCKNTFYYHPTDLYSNNYTGCT